MSLVVWCFSFSCLATESQLKVNKKAVIKGVAFKGDIEARRDKGILHRKHADIGDKRLNTRCSLSKGL